MCTQANKGWDWHQTNMTKRTPTLTWPLSLVYKAELQLLSEIATNCQLALPVSWLTGTLLPCTFWKLLAFALGCKAKGMSAPQFCYSLIGQGLFCAFCVCNTFKHLGWSGTGQSAGQSVDQLLAYRRGLIGSSCLVNKDVTSSIWDILSIGELQQTRCVVNLW